MSYSLGVTMDNIPISNDDAKILGLAACGLSNSQITSVTFIKTQLIYNSVSNLYSVLGTEKCINALIYKALLNGFDFECHFRGRDVLDRNERRRLLECVPRLGREPLRITIISTKAA